MNNMKKEINKHNKQVQKLREPPDRNEGCNCLVSTDCPMDGNCLAKAVIYRAEVVEDSGTTHTYTGLIGNTFKKRYY